MVFSNNYNLDWLKQQFDNEVNLKYVFFWGNRKNQSGVSSSCFSQWYESPFIIDGITYKTAEHWMMAQKALLFGDNNMSEKIITVNSPAEAKKLGREVSDFDENLWNKHRYEIVQYGNIYKFNQNKELGEFLMNTNTRVLVEASPVDQIWGIGLSKDSQDIYNVYNWRGLNLLGFALMEVRDYFMENGFFDASERKIDKTW